jgi:hypothetical protein
MIDTNSEAFKAANCTLSLLMVINLLKHTSLDDDARKAIPAQMKPLTLELLKAWEGAKIERAKSTYRQAQVTIESNAHAKRLQAIYDAIGDMTIEQHNASVIKAHEAEKPSESTMLNVLADIRMITGLREKPMLLELAGEIGRLLAKNKTSKLVFHNRATKPLNTVIETTRESVPSIMAWYGAYWAGDPYTVTYDGRNVPFDSNGEPMGWNEGE